MLAVISHSAWAVDSQTTSVRNNQLNREITNKQLEQQFLRRDWISLRSNLSEYRLLRKHDPVLADYLEASILIEEDHRPDLALPLYEKILAQHPDYHFVRLAYAQALFADKQYAVADEQFAQIPTDSLHPQTLARYKLYRKYSQEAYKTQFNLNFNYERNDNINQAGENDTFLFYGLKFKKKEDSLPIKDQGIRWSAGVSKLFHLSGLHNLELSLQGDGIHYFKHTEYNEQSIRPSIAYVNRNSRRIWRVEPYADYQLYGGSIYKRQYGLYTQYQKNFTPNWQWRASYDIAKTSYSLSIPAAGNQHTLSSMLIYQGRDFYVYGGANFVKENNEYKQLPYRNVSLFAGGQYIWKETIGVRANVSVGWRHFDHPHFLSTRANPIRRKDKNYYAQLGIFTPKLEIYGFMPIFNIKYTKTTSNLPDLYNRDSWGFYISASKSF